MGDEPDALGFAAAERGAGLAQLEVAKAGVTERLEWPENFWYCPEKIGRLVDAQFEHLGDCFVVVNDVQHLWAVSAPFASVAGHEGGRQKVHLKFYDARSLALGAAALRAVERKPCRAKAAHPRLGHLREQLADGVEKTDVRRRHRARRAADRRLIHLVHGLDLFDALDRFFAPGFQRGPYGGQDALAHERAFAGAAHAGHDRETAKRHGDGDVLQIIFAQLAEEE